MLPESHAGAGGVRDLELAARVLRLRSRRLVTGRFAGAYASAFRGGGLEFEELRPYAPGDDPRDFDWNATARTGMPHVRRFREERDHRLTLALDCASSLRCPITRGQQAGQPRVRFAAEVGALLAAAAARVGDRCGLVTLSQQRPLEIPARRGIGHAWHLQRSALRAAAETPAAARFDGDLQALVERASGRGALCLLSDLRAPQIDAEPQRVFDLLRRLAQRHDLVCITVWDPSDAWLPRAGLVETSIPGAGQRVRLLDTSRKAVRWAHETAFQRFRASRERLLAKAGCDSLWLRCDRDPLQALVHFFEARALRPRSHP